MIISYNFLYTHIWPIWYVESHVTRMVFLSHQICQLFAYTVWENE